MRIRVMRVITRLNIGGPAIHVGLLSSRLDPARYETLLVAGQEAPDEGSMLDLGRMDARVRLVRLDTLVRRPSLREDVAALGGLVRLARSFRPHIVHTHLAKAGALGRIAGRLARPRAVIHTYHGSVFRGYFGARETAMVVGAERMLAHLTTRVIAITPSQRAEIIALGVARPDRIITVPLGLELAPFLADTDRAEARKELGIAVEAPVVGIVARLVPIKDVGTFLRAVAILKASLPRLVALVIGDGEDRADLEALATELGLDGACQFLGWRSDVACLYAACDVVALSSLNEGSPVSIIEAMAAARAVVATAVGGVPDVVEDDETGVLVPPRDPAALAASLLALLRDPERRARLGRTARADVYPKYDSSRLVARMDELYSELVPMPT